MVYLIRGVDSFLKRLNAFPRERLLVYGAGREGEAGNFLYRPFSREGFLADLVSCKAVMATAVYTLIGKALHLGKPCLALPMKGQFEQELNALLLARAVFGMNCLRVSDEKIAAFLYRLPEYRAALVDHPRVDNGELIETLRRRLANGGARVRGNKQRRDGHPLRTQRSPAAIAAGPLCLPLPKEYAFNTSSARTRRKPSSLRF